MSLEMVKKKRNKIVVTVGADKESCIVILNKCFKISKTTWLKMEFLFLFCRHFYKHEHREEVSKIRSNRLIFGGHEDA